MHAPGLKVEVYAGLSELGREASKAKKPSKRRTKKVAIRRGGVGYRVDLQLRGLCC